MTPENVKKLRNLMREVSDSYDRIETEKELTSEAIKLLSEDIGINKSVLKKACDRYHRGDLSKVSAEHDEVVSLVETAIR